MPTTPSQLVFTEEVQTSTIGDQVPNPPAGALTLFSNQDGDWYAKDSSGTVTPLGGGAYDSLTGPGETESPGALTQRGSLTVGTADLVTIAASTFAILTATGTTGGTGVAGLRGKTITISQNGNALKVFVYPGNPNGHVAATDGGQYCFGVTASGTTIWRSTAAGTTHWVQVGGGGGAEVTVNSGPLVPSGLVPLAITSQPLVPPSGIIQPLPPLIGFQFSGANQFFTTTVTVKKCAICAGRDGNLWACRNNAFFQKISTTGVASPAVVFTNVKTGLTVTGSLYGVLCSGPDGNLWTVAIRTPTEHPVLVRVTPTGVQTQFTLPSTLDTAKGAFSICAGADGLIYFTMWTAGTVSLWKVTRTGASAVKVHTAAGARPRPTSMCAGPDGNIWAALDGLVVVAPDGSVLHTFVIATPESLCAGPDGNVYGLGTGGPFLMRFQPVTYDSATLLVLTGLTAKSIVVGGGGDLWVCGSGATGFAKVTLEGAVTKYPVLGGTGAGGWMCVGSDGGFWFTDTTDTVVHHFPFYIQSGNYIATAMPTADPHVKGAMWNTGGTVKLSAG
jgi:streptogramin lyase